MRPTATRPDAIRSHNLRVVLGELHRRGALSRAQLTQDLGLNRSTIGALVAELAEYGLVSESAPQTRRGAGRPSHVVGPRPDGPYALAVDVDVHELVVAAIGLGGDMLARWTCAYPTERVSPEYVVDRIGEAHLAISAGPAGRGWVAGLGVSVPGTVRRADGRILVAPNLGWRDVTLADLITTRMQCAWPIVTANDADLGALSEHLRGSARGIEDVLFIAGRVGVGGGVIAGGMPLHGASGLAGEIGHIVVDPSGPNCHCGNRGCLETFVGESAFMRLSGRAHVAGVDGVADVVRLAGEGDARAAETVAYVCEWLGRGLASLANILNPAVIVIGGYLTSLLEAHHDLIRASFDANMRAAPGEEIDIRLPGLGRDSALYGAAEVGFSALLDDPVETASRFGYPPRKGGELSVRRRSWCDGATVRRFDELDAIGPFEVLRHCVRGAGFEVELIGAHGPGLIHAANGLTLPVTCGLGEPDAVIVPGGGWQDGRFEGARAQAERGLLPARLVALTPSLRWTGSVCTGAMLLVALASCSSDHRETLRWEVISNQGSDLTIRAMHGACDNGPHARSTETTRAVTVHVTTAVRSGACIALGVDTVLTIHLNQPLGGRSLAGCSSSPTDCTKYELD